MMDKRSLRLVAVWSPVLALGLFLLASIRAGLTTAAAARLVVAVVATQMAPGIAVWRLVRPRDGWWFEDVVMGLAVGTCLAVAVQSLAGILHAPWLALAVTPVLALVLLAVPRTRRRVLGARTKQLPLAWGPAVAGASLLYIVPTQAFYRTVPFSWSGFRVPYHDMIFHLSLASEIAWRGPVQSPFVLGEPLAYHWFSSAWVAQSSLAANVELDAVLLRFMPPFIAVVLVCAVAIAAVRISGRVWAGPVAAVLAAAAGDLSIYGGAAARTMIHHLSPSLGISNLVLVAAIVVLGLRWRSRATPRLSAIVLSGLAIAAAGMKGSALPVLVAGVALTSAVSWIFGWRIRHQIAKDLVNLSGCLLVSFLVLFRGNAPGLSLDPAAALSSGGVSSTLMSAYADPGILVVTVAGLLLLLSVLARGAGLIPALTRARSRRDPMTLLLLGIGLAGAGAVVMLAHPGRSQSYFLRNAMPALAIGSAIGIVGSCSSLRSRERLLVAGSGVTLGLVALAVLSPDLGMFGPALPDDLRWSVMRLVTSALVIAGGGFAISRLSSDDARPDRRVAVISVAVAICTMSVVPVLVGQVRDPLPPYAQAVEPRAARAFSGDQVEAARWLRNHSDPSEVVMTNRHCGSPDPNNCDSRRFYVAAYTERRVFVEGWSYTSSWVQTPRVDDELADAFKPFWDPERLALNDGFLESPERHEWIALHARGVRWIFIDKTADYSRDLVDFAEERYETEWAWVLELDDPEDA